ncbi:Mu-like prophage major head subunit gpT family protein [Sphingomonas sp. MG17]|uniref:Mu-like prophage major head subunit gpT family protein n=1 Tax=Sphingomonas tagetis TaxID=2949092 RepID=A0A9X2HIK6_9SPHN|nr:prohead protease/major capsid protein fusion protein [Sphingomonas tagetis]MCP3730652.1 Mu-like prophage major head subunit gpT family protein [Sphingomonas tagetis]
MSSKRFTPPQDHRQFRTAQVAPSSFNAADNSFEICWTTGAAVLRFDWCDGEYYDETLSVEPGAVRLDRLNDRAPFLNSHNDRDINAVIGSVVPNSIRLEGGSGYARVQLASSDDVRDVVAKIKDGHLRKVSVGYHVYVFERIERAGQRAEMRAVDWEPVEISLVAVPADPGAGIRSKGRNVPEIRNASAADDAAVVTARFVREKCRNLDLDDADTLDLIEQFTSEPHSRSEFLEAMIDRVGRRNQELSTGEGGWHPRSRQGSNNDWSRNSESAARYAASRSAPHLDNSITSMSGYSDARGGSQHPVATRMQNALYARIAGKAPNDDAREFMGASMLDLAKATLEMQGRRNLRFESSSRIWQMMSQRGGALTTSDFPIILAGALNQYLTEQYRAAPSPLLSVARAREVSDFREIKALWVDGAVQYELVAENGEYTYGRLIEGSESYRIATFGKILALTRQLLINDNLGAFSDIGGWFAREAGRKRADTLSAVLMTWPALADGVPLFHASRGNLASSGSFLSATGLDAARQAMRRQTDRDGITKLGLTPKTLVVGPKSETAAEQLLATIAAAKAGDVNAFAGKLELVVDHEINDYRWYLFADPAVAPVIEYATLRGQGDNVFIDTRVGFEVDAIETKARIDFGAGIIDYRGVYMNPGAAPS